MIDFSDFPITEDVVALRLLDFIADRNDLPEWADRRLCEADATLFGSWDAFLATGNGNAPLWS